MAALKYPYIAQRRHALFPYLTALKPPSPAPDGSSPAFREDRFSLRDVKYSLLLLHALECTPPTRLGLAVGAGPLR
jgi:hypothetical protein